MNKFLLAYHGSPKFESKEAGIAHMVAWRAWSQGLGDAVVDPGMPVGMSKTITSNGSVVDGGGANPLSGITVLRADSIEQAIALAQSCPHLSAGGTIEIAQAFNMDM